MKNMTIILVSVLAVIICCILAGVLIYPVPPDSLVLLSFVIGIITGVFIAVLIYNLKSIIRTKRLKKAN